MFTKTPIKTPIKTVLWLTGSVVLALSLFACTQKEERRDSQLETSTTSLPALKEEPAVQLQKAGPEQFAVLKKLVADNTPIYFQKDSVLLRRGEVSKLERIAEEAKKYQNVMLSFKGHTAKAMTESARYNLSIARGQTIRWWFEYRLGLDLVAVQVYGYGSTRRVDTGNSEAARAKNRRVVIEVDSATQR